MKEPTIKWLPDQNGWCVFSPDGQKLAAFERNKEALDYVKSWMDEQKSTADAVYKGLI